MYIYIALYLVLINLMGLISMWLDKQKAIKRKWRIKERTLFIIAIFGGSLGSLSGMYLFRHKTKHNSFVIGMPVILLLQIAGVFIYFYI